ncbi:MAG: hypothetical protein J4A00_02565 [Gammaproteobacteria bacterium]|nr:hypothetical protein [Gammaproteobacteria bacterium]
MNKQIQLLTSVTLILLLTACSHYGIEKKALALDTAMNRYATAVRWGEWNTVYRMHLPLNEAKIPPEAIKTIRVTAYQELGAAQMDTPETATRVAIIRYINEETQAEASLRQEQRWRYDSENLFWGLDSPPPFFD